ncbi:uncharacterized protein FIESC28_01997 [Fusarium coffeatum]|uniref:F-box domain-containing protein n=1 Tax=Fusarium coffeatum TaxID=231269 RepID=A0A366S723_9HYPO|nr:uncharacterized protein FIESC28_01997 [Fusarium coffeatum]RBR25089.1 hypothetical protein FIESC28_01997 [Fusarium coffeatum]
MDRLPPEIISNIVHHVEEGSLAPLSVLCRRWQPIVEARIYRELHISRVRPGAQTLRKSIRYPSYEKLASNLTPTRLSYIRHLHVEIYVYGSGFSVTSTDIIRQIFDLLTLVPHKQEPLLNLHFNLRGFFNDFFEPDSRSSGSFESPPSGLPELPMVRSCQLKNGWPGPGPGFPPRALFYMASKMPRLRTLDVITWDIESIHQRVELARSLTDLPTSIHGFFFRFLQSDNSDGLLVMENGEDILTRELRRFSQREGLKYFLFSGCVELSIFWPPDSATSEPRYWPTLEAFHILFRHPQHLASLHATESPDDTQDTSDSDTESLDDAQDANDSDTGSPDDTQDANISDRIEVHKGIMNASFRALAKCSACMPKAKVNYIYFGDTWCTYFTYCTMLPGDPCVIVNGESDFELDEETVDEWRKTAEVHNLDFRMLIGEVPE